jgi:hypothetical protein
MNDFHIKLFSKILFCILPWIFALGCKKNGEPFSGPPNEMKRYPYERFHLTYEYSGDVRGTEEMFVSGYGKYEARYSKFDVLTPQEIHSSDNGAITRIADIYTIDFSKMLAIHEHSRSLDSLYHLEGSYIPSSKEYIEAEMKKKYFQNVATDIIEGKPALKWQEIDGHLTLWIWNGLLLRRHASSPEGSLEMKIKSIDTLWVVDTTKFSVPKGFTVKEAENMKHAPDSN